MEDVKYKACLVANGYSQKECMAINKVFSPVVKYNSIHMFLFMVTTFDLELEQLNVKTFFLHDELEEKIYMRQSKGFAISSKEDNVYLLKKSLYGLKQLAR